MSRYVLPGSWPGLLKKGNIDIYARPVVKLPGGQIATVRTISFGINNIGKFKHVEILVPTVVGDRVVSNQQAIRHWQQTGKHLGWFDTPAHANRYAIALHNEQARYYQNKKGK